MKYKKLRDTIKTGDILAVKGKGFVGEFIRRMTGESYSHVAIFIWLNRGLFVFEFVEGVGYQSMPASEWLWRREGQSIWVGKCPEIVRCNSLKVRDFAFNYRHSENTSYGWLSLAKVWWSSITKKKIEVIQKVCSTFAQSCWNAGEYEIHRTASPGTMAGHCESLTKITF